MCLFGSILVWYSMLHNMTGLNLWHNLANNQQTSLQTLRQLNRLNVRVHIFAVDRLLCYSVCLRLGRSCFCELDHQAANCPRSQLVLFYSVCSPVNWFYFMAFAPQSTGSILRRLPVQKYGRTDPQTKYYLLQFCHFRWPVVVYVCCYVCACGDKSRGRLLNIASNRCLD